FVLISAAHMMHSLRFPNSGNSLGDHRKLAEGIRGLPRIHWKHIEGDWELIGNAPRFCQKMIETCQEFARGYREDYWELGRSLDMLVKLIIFVCLSMS
ncbi:hypothetical protein GW17_00051905, partial [Ensete ventricosum]